jgi:hypothetical protein
VVKIGTRALISINGKPMLATHWDGYPSSLGKELLDCDNSIEAILRIAERHTIDSADSSVREALNRKRIKDLSEKHQLTEEEILEGKRRGAIIVAEDYEIGDIKEYGDWAEYEYDIRGEVVFFRPLRGPYPESIENAESFKILSQDRVIEHSER